MIGIEARRCPALPMQRHAVSEKVHVSSKISEVKDDAKSLVRIDMRPGDTPCCP